MAEITTNAALLIAMDVFISGLFLVLGFFLVHHPGQVCSGDGTDSPREHDGNMMAGEFFRPAPPR